MHATGQHDVTKKPSALPEVFIVSTPISDTLSHIPAAVSLINAEKIERGDVISLANEVNKIPGVQMQQGAINTSRISIRGLGARSQYSTNRVKAYLDGIPLTTGEGETTLEDIDLNLIKRIEIIKGPNSNIYGSGLGGAINIETKKPLEDVTGFDLNFSGGSYGYWQRGVSAFTSSYDSFIQLGYYEMDKRGFRENSEYDRKNVSLYAKTNLTEKTSISAFGLYTHLKAYIPSSLNMDDFKNNPEKAAFTWGAARGFESYDKILGGVTLKHDFWKNTTSKTSLFINARDGYEPRPFDILDDKSFSFGIRSTLNSSFDILGIAAKSNLGVEYYDERYTIDLYENLYVDNAGMGSLQGDHLSNQKQKRKYLNLFAQLGMEFTSGFKGEVGLSYNHSRYVLDDGFSEADEDRSGVYTYPRQFLPHAGLTYEVAPRKFVYATVSRGFSLPSVAETLTPDGQLNPDLKPETGINYEAGLKFNWLNNRLYTELAAYTIKVENLIVAQRIAQDRYVGVNAGKTDHTGVELTVNYLHPAGAWTVNPYGSLALNDHTFNEFTNNGVDYSGNELTGVAKCVANLGLEVKHESGLKLNLNLRSEGKTPLNDGNTVYYDGYELVNFRVDYGFGLSDLLNGYVFGGVNNVFDADYAAQILPNAVGFGGTSPRFYYPGEPINFYLGIKMQIR